jgi:hypothetical protein
VLGTDDPTFPLRLAFGLAALAVLAVVDIVRHPRNPTRVKEYGFLFAVTSATMIYGLVHDFVTYSISWEYFAIGKGIPEAASGFGWPVVRLALMASWSAGLFIGVVFLIANNPSPRMPQMPYSILTRYLVLPLCCSLAVPVVLGIATHLASKSLIDGLALRGLALENPRSFVTVSGIHAGTYLGGLVGTLLGAVSVRQQRRRIRGK